MGSIFDYKIFIEPPKKLQIDLYRCDCVFHTNDLQTLCRKECLSGIVWISGSQTEFYTIDVTCSSVKKVAEKSVRLKHHNKGGSSSGRFERLHQEAVQHYLDSVVEISIDLFRKSEIKYVLFVCSGKRIHSLLRKVGRSIIKEKIIAEPILVGEKLGHMDTIVFKILYKILYYDQIGRG